MYGTWSKIPLMMLNFCFKLLIQFQKFHRFRLLQHQNSIKKKKIYLWVISMRFSESSNQINQDIYNENRPLTKLPSNYCFDGIDLIKFICAFLVCIIHISPLPTESLLYSNYINFGLQQYICRIAVPFYFMASGFFLFRKIDLTNIDTNRIQKYCFKALRLLGTWTLLLVVGRTGHLWYLGALVVAVVLISVLLKYHIKFKYIALLSILLYIIGLLGDSYHGII